jgi:hypothetical protein
VAKVRSHRVFISYRRAEASDLVGRLHDWLVREFGEKQVFVDVSDIVPGDDFRKAIADAVGNCEVLLVVIDPHWIGVADSKGRRRLDNPDDFVRLEVAAALKRGVRVIPVLVNGAAMPSRSDLPEDLERLADRHWLTMRAETFRSDMERLISAVDATRNGLQGYQRALPLLIGLLLVLAAGAFAFAGRVFDQNLPILMADAVAVVTLGAVGVWMLTGRSRSPIGDGAVLGIAPFIGLRMWRSAELRNAIGLTSVILPILAVVVACGLLALLLSVKPNVQFGYQRPHGRAVPMLILLSAVVSTGLAVVGNVTPTSEDDLGTLRLSDPMVLAFSVVLTLAVIGTQGAVRAGIQLGWAGGAILVLANTVWLRFYSGFSLPPVLNAHLLLSAYMVAVLLAASILGLRDNQSLSAESEN